MNKLNQVLSVLVVTTVIFLPLFGRMDEIKDKLYKSIERPTIYNAGVYTIDKTAKFLSNGIVLLAHITDKKELALQKIDRRLVKIEENIKNDELNAINALYQEFNVSGEDQQTINSILRQYKELQKQILLSSVQKGCNTLECASSEILSFCEQVGINPNAIQVKKSDTSKSLLADARGLRATYQFENNALIINDDDIISYPSVILYPGFFELSYDEENACLAHELTHLALQHHTVINILGREISYFTGAKKEEIIKSKNWKNLEIIHERQAEVLLKDAEWASRMRDKRNGGYYPDHLFLKHYAQLTEIDELHRLKEKLKK